ncbi:hypothetical protein Emed_004161 [Eimeria media]
MATRLVFRRHNHYNTASNRVRRVKTPGSKVVYLNVRKQASRQKCGGCGRALPGIPARRPPQFKLLKKRERTVNRAYGGTRCHSCVREKILRAFLVEEQKCVKQVLQVKERQKREEHVARRVRRFALCSVAVSPSSQGFAASFCDYRSRSAFKLEQLDDEFLFLRKDRVVLDLGCYPGGWSQVAARRCLVGEELSDGTNETSASTSRVIGVDIAQMDPLPLVQFIQGRVGDASTLRAVLQELRDQKADVVLSDMAPSCTGIRHEDHFNSMELCLYAADLMEQTLCVGGTFVVKVFMGSELANYKTYLKSRFELVRSAKPRACRQESREMYFVCIGFKGRDKISEEVQIKGSFSAREGYA